jgi:hypothetical protein
LSKVVTLVVSIGIELICPPAFVNRAESGQMACPKYPQNWMIGVLSAATSMLPVRARNRRSVRSRSGLLVALRDDRWPRPSRDILPFCVVMRRAASIE